MKHGVVTEMTKCPVCGLEADDVEVHEKGLARTLEPEESKNMFRCQFCGFRVEDVAEHEKQEHIRIVRR